MTPLLAAREWVGSQPPDGELLTIIAQHDGDPKRAALAVLRRRRADMSAQAAQWAVAGDYSQSTVANIKALDDLIGRLERDLGLDDGDGLPTLKSAPICGPTTGR